MKYGGKSLASEQIRTGTSPHYFYHNRKKPLSCLGLVRTNIFDQNRVLVMPKLGLCSCDKG